MVSIERFLDEKTGRYTGCKIPMLQNCEKQRCKFKKKKYNVNAIPPSAPDAIRCEKQNI